MIVSKGSYDLPTEHQSQELSAMANTEYTVPTPTIPHCPDCGEKLHWGPMLITGHHVIICDAYAHQFLDLTCQRKAINCLCPAGATGEVC